MRGIFAACSIDKLCANKKVDMAAEAPVTNKEVVMALPEFDNTRMKDFFKFKTAAPAL